MLGHRRVLLRSPVVSAGGIIVYDTFTDTDGTLLSAHTPDIYPVGASYALSGTTNLRIVSNTVTTGAGETRGIAVINSGYANCVISLDVVQSSYATAANYDRYPAIIFRHNGTTHFRAVFNRYTSKLIIYLGSTNIGETDAYSTNNNISKLIVTLNGDSITATGILTTEETHSVIVSNSTNNTETNHGVYSYRDIYDSVDNLLIES